MDDPIWPSIVKFLAVLMVVVFYTLMGIPVLGWLVLEVLR